MQSKSHICHWIKNLNILFSLSRRLEFQIHFTQRFMDALLKNKLRSQGSAAALVSSAAVGGSLIGRVPYHYLGMNSAGCYRRPGWTFFF